MSTRFGSILRAGSILLFAGVLSASARGDDSIIGMLGSWAAAQTAIKDKLKEQQSKKASLLSEKLRLGDSQTMLTSNMKHIQDQLAAAGAQLAATEADRERHNANPPDDQCAGCVAQYNAAAAAGNAKMREQARRVQDLRDNLRSLEQSRADFNDRVVKNAHELDSVEAAIAKLAQLIGWVLQKYNECLELASDGAAPETIKYKCGNIQFDGEDVHLSNPDVRPSGSCILGTGPGCRSEAQPSDRDMPTVPSLTTAVERDRAVEERDRLAATVQKLQAEVAKVQRWRSDEKSHQEDYERLREEALRGALGDVLSAIPAEKATGWLAKSSPYAKYLSADFEAKIGAAYKAAQGVVSVGEGVSQSDHRFKKIAEGQLELRRALQISVPMDQEAKKWLEGMDRLFELGVKVAAFGLQARDQSQPVSWRQIRELSAEAGGALYPPLGTGLAAVNVAERVGKYYTAKYVMEDLSNVVAQNWRAEFYLNGKIDRLNQFIAEENRTIEAFNTSPHR